MKQNKLLIMVLKTHQNQSSSLEKDRDQKIVLLALHILQILMMIP